MQTRYARLLASGMVVAIVLGGCGSKKPLHGTITGVQTPASQPLVRAWGARFADRTGAQVRARIGDAAGFTGAAADFAVSDEPLDPADHVQREAVAIPLAMSPVAIAYRLMTFAGKRVPTGVRLDGKALAGVYDGVKFNWAQTRFIYRNNARLGLRLPDELFSVCRNPGTATINTTLTTYLTRSSPTWARLAGIAAHVRWPPVSATDTADLATCVKEQEGAIGYMPLADARREQLTVALLEAPSGRGPFYAPEQPSYPIQAPELALVWRDMCRAGLSSEVAVNVRAWLDFALGASGQGMVSRYGYQPLPAAARERARAQVAALRCDGRRISVPRA
jgi:phosphate transport system substrate-binding protein